MGDGSGDGRSERMVLGRPVGGFSWEVVGAAPRADGYDVAFSDPAFYLRFPEREGAPEGGRPS